MGKSKKILVLNKTQMKRYKKRFESPGIKVVENKCVKTRQLEYTDQEIMNLAWELSKKVLGKDFKGGSIWEALKQAIMVVEKERREENQ